MLGWEPASPVRDGLARTVEYFRGLLGQRPDRIAHDGSRAPRARKTVERAAAGFTGRAVLAGYLCGSRRTDATVPGRSPICTDLPGDSPRRWSLVAVAACRPEFQLKNFTTNEALYTASMREYQRHHWDNAVAGFEKLTTDLPPRDSLLPRSYWYLASAHEHMGEHLLAAQSYNRLVETFPEDSLADDAALEAARSYRRSCGGSRSSTRPTARPRSRRTTR